MNQTSARAGIPEPFKRLPCDFGGLVASGRNLCFKRPLPCRGGGISLGYAHLLW
jgi:hypothetical protein